MIDTLFVQNGIIDVSIAENVNATHVSSIMLCYGSAAPSTLYSLIGEATM
jgi:hypothetical protein